MANGNGALQVSQLLIRQAPQLNQSGQVSQTTTVSFMVGQDGPFVVTWPTGTPAPADILAAITAQVDKLKTLRQQVATLNQQTAASTPQLP